MTYIERIYGLAKKAYAFKVSFYDGTERNYKSGAAADKCARRNALAGHYCALLALTDDGWEELAAC